MSTVPRKFGEKSQVDSNTKIGELSEKELSSEEFIVDVASEPSNLKRRFTLWSRKRENLDAIATKPSVFDDPVTLEVYRPPPSYENAHRFDPTARWTLREEIVGVNLLPTRDMN